MWRKDSASSDRGSMAPFFGGLVAIALVLAFGAAEVCSSYLFRESMQESADQLALVAIKQKIKTAGPLAAKLTILDSTLTLARFQLVDGITAETRLCGDWNGWFHLPGLDSKQRICVDAAAR